MEISIIIPAYNEAHRIRPTVAGIAASLKESGRAFEIVVVDDGSTDSTASVVRELASGIDGLSCSSLPSNRGKGSAVRSGMLAATGAIRVMCDADGSMGPEELPKLIDPIFAGDYDVVIGSRYVEGADCDVVQPRWRRMWSRLARRVTHGSLGIEVRDVHCGYKAFSGPAAERVFSVARLDGWSFDLEILALTGRFGMRLKEQGIRWRDDKDSRVRPLADLPGVIREYLRLRHDLNAGTYDDAPRS